MAKRPKNIVLLSDGTGNSAAKLFKTNVWRLYTALDLTDETRQVAYYDDGVGSSSFRPLALLGGAFGWGLKRNVIDLYTFLCRNYEEGDRIYCFGFSRGAFTIRILTGVVNSQGLVHAAGDEELHHKATAAFERYRNVFKHLKRRVGKACRQLKGAPKTQKESAQSHPNAREFAFVGLWDTVAAYGIPIPGVTHLLSYVVPLSVPDRNPCPIVRRACHALALDDERHTFHPVLWNEADLPAKHKHDAANIRDEIITQVWFAGMHSDVGGGYAEEHLALSTFDWMVGEASGLHFDQEALKRLRAAMNVNGMLHNSRGGTGQAYRYLPRRLDQLCNERADPENQVLIKRPKVHESVFRRIANSDDSYAPIVLPAHYAVVDARGDIHDLPKTRPAPGSAFMLESAAEAQERVAQQKPVWDLVQSVRWLYVVSALVVLALVAFRWWPGAAATRCGGGWQCWLEKAIRWIGSWLPDFLEPWFAAYASWPIAFAVLVVALWLLLKRSALVRLRIKDRMRAIWLRKNVPAAPPLPRETVTAGA